MSLEHNAQSAANHSFPRVSGDEPTVWSVVSTVFTFSGL